MSDFINQLPPSLRDAIAQQQMPEMSDDFKARLIDKMMRECPENEEEFTKMKRK